MDNPGKYPVDPSTEVGKLRAVLGDTSSKPFDPPRPGIQNYGMYSDAELEAFLALSEGSVAGGAFFAYSQMAASAATESRTVADYDLKYDSTKRPGEFRALAQMWKDKWDGEQADVFEVFDTVGQPTCYPELAAWPVGVCRGNRLF